MRRTQDDEAFSKFRLDSLARYLETNKPEIVSLLTGHELYTVGTSDSPQRVSESNTVIDFVIPVAGTKATILALADAGDLIVKIEHYTESEPSVITTGSDRRFPKNAAAGSSFTVKGRSIRLQSAVKNAYKIACFDLNGRALANRIITPQNGAYTMTVNRAPSLSIFSVNSGNLKTTHRTIMLP